jgi:long-subunit fatty acid transport protein
VFSNRGAINVDLEYVDYRWANLKTTKDQTFTPTNYTVQNRQVDTTLRAVLNIRVGGEWVFQSQYFIRGGIGYYGQPYRTDLATENTSATIILSGGAGIKLKRSSIDVAYRRTNRNFSYFAFAESETSVNSQKHGFVFTYALQF